MIMFNRNQSHEHELRLFVYSALYPKRIERSLSILRWALAMETVSITPVGSISRCEQNPGRS